MKRDHRTHRIFHFHQLSKRFGRETEALGNASPNGPCHLAGMTLRGVLTDRLQQEISATLFACIVTDWLPKDGVQYYWKCASLDTCGLNKQVLGDFILRDPMQN